MPLAATAPTTLQKSSLFETILTDLVSEGQRVQQWHHKLLR